jgi:hypothetical protein
VLVLVIGSALVITWAAERVHANAILAWLPGQQGGHGARGRAVRSYSPAGRLPSRFRAPSKTFPTSGATRCAVARIATSGCSPSDNGLSFTRIEYTDAGVSKAIIGPADEFEPRRP